MLVIFFSIAMAEAMRNDMIRKYSEMDIDELLSQLNENELEQLSGMVCKKNWMLPLLSLIDTLVFSPFPYYYWEY